MDRVTITPQERDMAIAEAGLQMARKIACGRNRDHGYVVKVRDLKRRYADTVNGLKGEIALSRYLSLPWTPGGFDISRGDVDGRIEVRTTHHPDGHLLIYEDDKDASWFVLAIGRGLTFGIAGAMIARKAKRVGRWRETSNPPCFWVRQELLIPTWRWKRNNPEEINAQPVAGPSTLCG